MKMVSFVLILFILPITLISGATINVADYWQVTGFSNFSNVILLSTKPHTDFISVKRNIYTSTQGNCNVDISSEYSIQSYLEQGLRTEDNGGSTITYEILSDWNTVGLVIRFDNGTVVKGINVKIRPGYSAAKITVDFPSIGSADYYLYSNGLLESADGSFRYGCR